MATSQTFDGFRITVKFPWQTVAHFERLAGENSRENVIRQWIEERRTLFGLAPSLYQRLVYSAKLRHLSVESVISDALTKYCTSLPELPDGVTVATPIDLIEMDEPARAAKTGPITKKVRR